MSVNVAGTTVSIPLEMYNRLKYEVTAAQMRAEELRGELEAERAKTPDTRLRECAELLEAFKTIADHAVANLSPEFIRDLPAEAFQTAAGLVARVLGATQRDGERAGVWAERAQHIFEWRDKRKARGWDDMPPALDPEKKRKPAKKARRTR